MSEPMPEQELPSFIRRTGLANWNRYAAVNEEFVPMHMDDGAGQAFGFPGAIGMGNLQIAYIHNFLRDWMGDAGRIAKVACEFRAPNLKDTVVTVQGIVTNIEESADARQAQVTFTVTGSGGPDESSVVLARGSATVEHVPQKSAQEAPEPGPRAQATALDGTSESVITPGGCDPDVTS